MLRDLCTAVYRKTDPFSRAVSTKNNSLFIATMSSCNWRRVHIANASLRNVCCIATPGKMFLEPQAQNYYLLLFSELPDHIQYSVSRLAGCVCLLSKILYFTFTPLRVILTSGLCWKILSRSSQPISHTDTSKNSEYLGQKTDGSAWSSRILQFKLF